jgi:Zn-dependent protease with chaperone function
VSAQPGWYPDPQWMSRERYWDGRSWTDRSRPAGEPGGPPLLSPPQPVSGPRKRTGTGPAALIVLIPVLTTEAAIIVPCAVAAQLRWPSWGAALPLAVWVGVAFLLSVPRIGSAVGRGSIRAPTEAEQTRLAGPWQSVTQRASLSGSTYRLGVTDQDDLNACTPSGRLVIVTAKSARSPSTTKLEAVLAHELGHRSGWRGVATFANTRLSWPSKLLWWTLRTLWTPVGPMWKRAVEWHRPIGFLLVFLLAATATAFTMVAAIPAALTHATRLMTRPLTEHTEYQADAYAVRLGLGTQLLAAIEHEIESAPAALPLPLVNRAQRLRRRLS